MIENRPSWTAVLIGLVILILSGDADGRSKIPSGSAQVQEELLRGLLPRHFWLIFALAKNPIISKLVRSLLSFIVYPKLLDSAGVRKCFIEEHVRRRIADHGCRQVLVLAAGYDTLALRLSREFSSVQFWELDHPTTSQMKQEALVRVMKDTSSSLGVPENLHLVAADLAIQGSLQQALLHPETQEATSAQYDPKACTVVVMEGILMYLTTEQVQQLFSNVANITGGGNKENKNHDGSSVCFDFFGRNENTKRADLGWLSAFVYWAFAQAGESFYFAIEPDKLVSFFADTPWHVLGSVQAVGWDRLAVVQQREL